MKLPKLDKPQREAFAKFSEVHFDAIPTSVNWGVVERLIALGLLVEKPQPNEPSKYRRKTAKEIIDHYQNLK